MHHLLGRYLCLAVVHLTVIGIVKPNYVRRLYCWSNHADRIWSYNELWLWGLFEQKTFKIDWGLLHPQGLRSDRKLWYVVIGNDVSKWCKMLKKLWIMKIWFIKLVQYLVSIPMLPVLNRRFTSKMSMCVEMTSKCFGHRDKKALVAFANQTDILPWA